MIRTTVSRARGLAPIVSGALGTRSSGLVGGYPEGYVEKGVLFGRRASTLSPTTKERREEGWEFSSSRSGMVGVVGVAGVLGWKMLDKEEEEGFGVVLAEEKQRKQHPYFPELVNLGEGGKATERYQHLLGYGRRVVMSIFTAYEVGFYVDTLGKEKLVGKVGKPKNETIEMLLAGDHSRMLRLMTYRNVPSSHLKGGYQKSLYPAMLQKRSKYNVSEEEAKDLFQRFLGFIPDVVPTSTPLHFVCHPPNILEFYVENELKDKIESPLLCESLFEIYLGEQCITPELRDEASKGIQFL